MDSILKKFLGKTEGVLPKSLHKTLPSLLNIGLLAVVFFLLNWWYRSLTEISGTNFSKFVLVKEPQQYFSYQSISFYILVLILVLTVFRYKLLLTKWRDLFGGNFIRAVVGCCTVMLCWVHISYPHPYFIDESVILERIGVAVLTGLVLWRPFFLIPFLLYPIILHFGEPFLVNNWSVTEMPMRLLILFGAQLILFLIVGKLRWDIGAFIFLLFGVLMGNYFPAGLGKLLLGWLSRDHLYLFLPGMYADGWMGFLSEETISQITIFLAKFNTIFKVIAIILEFGCIFFLIRKVKSITFFLIGFVLFHFVVFLLTGIGFLPWVLVELILLYGFYKKNILYKVVKNYTKWHIILSFFMIIGSPVWLMCSVYAWYESPINYVYEFEVEDEFGNTSYVPTELFWPKYFEFHRFNFHYLHKKQTLSISWVTVGEKKLLHDLITSKSAEEIFAIEHKYGENKFNKKLASDFDTYFSEFINDRDTYKLRRNPWLTAISAPPQRISMNNKDNLYLGDTKIVKLTVYQKLSYFDGKTYQIIRERPVYHLNINSE